MLKLSRLGPHRLRLPGFHPGVGGSNEIIYVSLNGKIILLFESSRLRCHRLKLDGSEAGVGSGVGVKVKLYTPLSVVKINKIRENRIKQVFEELFSQRLCTGPERDISKF